VIDAVNAAGMSGSSFSAARCVLPPLRIVRLLRESARLTREPLVGLVLDEPDAVDAVAHIEMHVAAMLVPQPHPADIEIAAFRPARRLELHDADPPAAVIEPGPRATFLP
jgi:hypothetical protein